jgi:hypothetical protein
MELTYDEIHAPLAAFYVYTHQIVVLDHDLVPIWFGITAHKAVS